jgi:hypothetical protein
MNHFTDKGGFDAIKAASPWRFRASQPPGNHPFGAYFTTLTAHTPNLAKRLGIPKWKLEYLFSFDDLGDLIPLPGGRGEWILYSPQDYYVVDERQGYHGKAEES